MKARTLLSCCHHFFILLFVHSSTCQEFLTTPPFTDISQASVLQATNQCDDSCSSNFNETVCTSFGTCILQCPSSSRTSLPSSDSSSVKDNCADNKKPPVNPPPAARVANGNLFYNSSTGNCVVSKTGDLTKRALSVWIKGSCDKCSFLRIGETSNPFLSVSLSNQSELIVNDKPYGQATSWTHLLIQKSPNNSLSVFINGDLKTALGYTNLPTKIQIGVAASLSSGSVHILDFRYYKDLLTDREVKQLHSNAWDGNYDVPNCRCPVTHPSLDTTGLLCLGDSSAPRHRLVKTFHDVSVIADGNASTAWFSGNSDQTKITVTLGNTFQISSVQLWFVKGVPQSSSWKFYLNGNLREMKNFICDVTRCHMNGKVDDYEKHLKTVTDKIEVILQSSENLIISQLRINASCNCNGNAENCTQASSTSNDYTCSCSAFHNVEGEHCENCKNKYFRLESEFACMKTCPGCNTMGSNSSRMCMQIGGKCNCKPNVEGTQCDTCKHLTYQLGSTPEGCLQSDCTDLGSESCDNKTGECRCFPNVTGGICDRCSALHYNISSGGGCQPCLCDAKGTVHQNMQCNVITGNCNCKTYVAGRPCDECKDSYWNLQSTNDVGCTECDCNMIGSAVLTCHKQTGQCPCWSNDFINRQCIPTFTKVEPKYGPEIGGTLVTITGHLLNGSSMYFPKIYLNERIMSIISESETKIIFQTNKTDLSKQSDIELRWNQQSHVLKLGTFSYKPDPELTSPVVPAVKAFTSGGCQVTFTGTNLNSVSQPKVKVTAGADVQESVCKVESGRVIKCPLPPLKVSPAESRLSVDLQLDGKRYTNITQVTVVQDPQLIDDGNLDFRYPFEKTITIKGARLEAACQKDDITVTIGTGQCRNVKLSDTAITCEPPADTPGQGKEFTIEVSIGFFSRSVGKLYYRSWWETQYFVYIMVGIAAFLLLFFIVLIAVCCCVCRRRRHTDGETAGAELLPVSEQQPSNAGNDFKIAVSNPAYISAPAAVDADMVVTTESFLHQLEESIRGNVGECLIAADQFQIKNVCSHKGMISRVVNGNFTVSAKTNPSEELLVKMPQKSVVDKPKLPKWTSSVLREALRLQKHEHSSILTIYGIGLDSQNFYLLYPHMENRTLKDHIVMPSNNFLLHQLVKFCVNVAEGMAFLSSKGIVHKDLAARNCWVDSNQMVKVGDGSFSYDLYPQEYMFDKQKDRHIPVRWMAPESLQSGFYDTKSDIWSFGIVMWEVLTRGLLPFQEIPDDQVKNYIVKGYRLGKPHLVCDDLFLVLNVCWDAETEDRPTFSTLTSRFRSMMDAETTLAQPDDVYINVPTRPDSIYVNLEEQQLRKQSRRSNPHDNIYGNVP